MDQTAATEIAGSRPPVGHPDYEFPKEVHNLLVAAQTTHLGLSAMADSKASILMGATFVVFTLAMGQIGSTEVTVPLLLLGSFSFAAAVMSVLAIRPKLVKPRRVPDAHTNMLFFGSFAGIPEEEYIDRIIEVMRTEESVYRSMARDLYQNGRVLQTKKYKYLTYAYDLFLIGLVGTFVAFAVQLLIGA